MHSPWRRVVGIGIVLSLVVGVIVLAFSWPGVTSESKNLPIAFVGEAAQLEQIEGALEQSAPGVIAPVTADDRADAVDRIEHREVYGAIVLGAQPEVLQASAASPVVSGLLATVAAQLQVQLTAAAAAQAQAAGVPAPTIAVTVTDVVPLAATDPRGVGLASAAFPLVLGGMIGGIAITMALVGAWRRIVALLVYAVVAGAVVAGVLQGWLGVLQGDYLANAGAYALAFAAIGAPIVGFAALVGRAGVALGPVLFLLIANPISSATQPVEFLPEPWGAVGQWFPPGAAATLVRELSYFPKADTTFPWLVLAVWALAGVLLALLGHFRERGAATQEALEEAVEEGALSEPRSS
ncbi:ABC transporter permease [Protaetiibacter larvae]|uniref:ABC transporter permease n=1 Tax=Protaetiibacter larvae TaxID=2592654 RepID=A0A5C1YBW4_9MICO|nr:ABC transporter permease [Protaetiibacter larvae]